MLLSSHQLPEVQELCDRVAIVRLAGASSTRARSPTCAARAAPATGCARPTTRARSSSRARQPGIEHAARRRARPRLPGRGARRRRALARARRAPGSAILALTPELATLEDLFFRLTEGDGTATPGRRRRRPAATRRGRRCVAGAMSSVAALRRRGRAARARTHRPSTLTVYRWELRKLVSQKRTYLGLGLLVAAAADLRGRREPAPAPRPRRRQHLRRADHAVGARDAGADAAVPVRLHAAAGRRAGRRRHRRQRGRQRHAEDDPHALGRPRAGVRRQGARRDDLRARSRCSCRPPWRPSPASPRGAFTRVTTLLGHGRLRARSAAARVRRQRRLPDPAVRGREHRRAALDRHAQQRRRGRRARSGS